MGGTGEVFGAFLRLGCTAFGGPTAHLAFFEEEFVRRRRWLAADDYASLVALCQFLPGPASSQVGFALGWWRAGLAGAFAAWAAFTAPSAALMLGAAYGLGALGPAPGLLAGLMLAAAAVVLQALSAMAPRLCPDLPRATLALVTGLALLVWQVPWAPPFAVALGLACGWALRLGRPSGAADILRRDAGLPPAGEAESARPDPDRPSPTALRGGGWGWLAAAAVLLAALPVAAELWPHGAVPLFDACYRAGALVFGGGHVVLPLLEAETVGRGWLGHGEFLGGYGAAQALPGPLFAFAAYLGAAADVGPGGVAGGLLALAAVFLPAWLLVLGALPFWERLRAHPGARAALAGANASVVGVLGAAFLDPVLFRAVQSPAQWLGLPAAFVLLRWGRMPPWALVGLCAAAGTLWPGA